MMLYLFLLSAFILLRSVRPLFILKQMDVGVSGELDGLELLWCQLILAAILVSILFLVFKKESLQKSITNIANQPFWWWQFTFVVATIFVITNWIFIYLLKKDDIQFLGFAGPIVLILTFLIAMYFDSNLIFSREKYIGVFFIAIGMYLFN